MSAIQYKSIKKDEIVALRELKEKDPNIEDLVDTTRASLLRAVDILSAEFSIHGLDFLPYEAHLIILSYICAKVRSFNKEILQRLRQWFWITAFSERYRGASEAFVTRDLEHVYNFVIENEGEILQFGAIPSEIELKGLLFRSDSSRSRAFILMLANSKPRNITNGAVIDPYEALSVYNKKHFHHIYPRAYLKQIESTREENCLVNICMLAASENNAIYRSNPNTYLPKYIKELKDQADDVFKSNILPDPTEFEYDLLDYDKFLDIRAKLVIEQMKHLCNL